MNLSVRLSVYEFDAKIRRGDFAAEDPRRLELIEGEMVEMPPPNPPHEDAVARLTRWSYRTFPHDAIEIRPQSSIGMPEWDSVPVPDLTWLVAADYSNRRPTPADVLLLIEVSDSTLSYDRNAKARLYAAAGLADYWIANLRGRCFEVLRDPGPEGYATKLVFHPGDEIRPLAFPEVAFPVSLIFPE